MSAAVSLDALLDHWSRSVSPSGQPRSLGRAPWGVTGNDRRLPGSSPARAGTEADARDHEPRSVARTATSDAVTLSPVIPIRSLACSGRRTGPFPSPFRCGVVGRTHRFRPVRRPERVTVLRTPHHLSSRAAGAPTVPASHDAGSQDQTLTGYLGCPGSVRRHGRCGHGLRVVPDVPVPINFAERRWEMAMRSCPVEEHVLDLRLIRNGLLEEALEDGEVSASERRNIVLFDEATAHISNFMFRRKAAQHFERSGEPTRYMSERFEDAGFRITDLAAERSQRRSNVIAFPTPDRDVK